MAKQVEDIVVRLVGKGFEALDKIKGSFRELGKVTNLAEKDILSARDSLLDFAKKAGNTEAVNKGLTDAFKGLRSQVDLSSDAYRSLSAELRRLDEESKGATRSVMAQRDAVLSSTAAGTQNVAALQQQRAALIALRTQTRESSTAFDQFSADIVAVETRLTNLAEVNRRFNAVLVQGTAATAAGARVQLDALTAGIALRRQDLADIDTRSARERNLRATIEQRLGVEQRLNTALSMRRRIQFQEGARTGREGARTGAATFNDPTVTAGFLAPDRIAQRIGDLPNTTAGLSQELGELNERLINTYRNTEIYTAVQLRLAAVQREVAAATQGFGAALRAQLDAGTLIPSQKNLAEVIGQLRREMLELDTTTTAGAQAYANNARQADQLDRQLRELAGAYRQVGSMATVAATAEQNAANARIRGNYLNRGAVRQQEQALRELGGRVQQGVAGTPLLLPAAGQTSAAGTGAAMSGGARRLTGQVETTFGAGVDARGYSPRSTFQQQFLPTAAVGTAPAVGFAAGAAQAFDNLGRSTDRARRPLRDIFAELERVRGASNGSVNSLQAQISAWTQIRSAVSSSAPVFATATKQIEALGRQQARLQVGRRAPSTGQLVQAGGAAISGGIFGGPEGFLGGVGGAVLGTALPGIGTAGGAFAGAAAGAQVGMFRQQLGGTADYAASIGKLQIALRGVVGSQAAYDAAIRAAAAATRDLNIPQEEATRGLTRLSAAVIGAGGTVADSSFAFRAMSEAIKATGGNAEQVDGALLALTQVFSKGKVSAEELNQIAERLPGTFTLFAQAAGKTGPELQKALEQGQVGLNDLMKFLALTSKRYGTTALEIAGSSQDAGARLTVAFQAMRLEVGKALQPLGAELQGAFAKFITEITPAVVGSAKAIAAAISFFTTNEVAGGLARFALQAGAVALALKALGLLVGPVKQGLAMMGAAFGTASAQAVVAQARLAALGTTVKALARSVAAPIVITVAILGAELVIKYFNRIKAARDRLTQVGSQATGEQWLREIGGNALDQQQLTGALNDVGKAYEIASTKASKLRAERDRLKKVQGFDAARVLSTLEDDLKVAEAEEKLLESRYKAGIARLPNAPKTAGVNGTNFPDPTGGEDTKDKAADKARKDAEAAAAEQQRYLESFMQQQIRVADTVFQHQKDLDRQRFDLLRELTDIEAQNRINKLFGPEREAANIQEQRRQRSLDYENRILTAMNAVAAARQKFGSAQQMAAVTAGASLPGGTVANILPGTRGGPNINEGVGYGRGRLHAGQDLGLDIGDPIHARRAGTVMQAYPSGFGKVGGAVVVRYDDGTQGTYGHTTPSVRAGTAVAAGQRIATVAPDGSNTHLHYELRDALGKLVNPINALTASLKVPAGRQATGVAAQQRRNVTDTGDVALAGLDITQAEATLANLTAQRDRFNAAFNQEQINALTASLSAQNNELEKTITIETKRFDLVLKGYSAERIALEQKFDQARIARDAALTGVAPGDETQVLAINTAYERQIVLLQDLYDAQTQFNNSFGAGFQTGVQQYVQSLGTMNQAAAQLTQTGLKGIEDTLFSLVTTGTANFREFAAEILKQSARMILQLTIQRVIMQILGAIGGGGAPASPSAPGGDWMGAVGRMNPTSEYAMGGTFAKNNIVPYAMGGVVSRPTLFKFAQGGTMRTGLMGEAGPEAIMPLSRGANGKLGVASVGGGGTTNVVVNVDASGNSQVAGDQTQGAQLGRVISQAVQQELIKQRRPGGLLTA